MNQVVISGYGHTKFSDSQSPIEQIMLEAVKSLFDQTENLEQKDIDAVLVSTNDNSKYLAATVSEMSGISPKISHSIETLCSSGTNSLVSAFSYIKSGLAENVLVIGADRFDGPGQIFEWDDSRGQFKHPVYWGSLYTSAYKRRYQISDEVLALVSAKNHKNAMDNPFAYTNKPFTVPEIMNSKKITDDLRLFDCCKPCTGAAAILVTKNEKPSRFTDCPISITGIGQKTISAGFTKTRDLTSIESTKIAAKDALKMADVEIGKIDVAEVHDAFSICEVMTLEDLGFVKPGNGGEMVRTLFNSENKMINPRGGLIGVGHPLGATGVSQVVEITMQLQNSAEKRQIDDAKIGLVQNMSAAATSSTVMVLES